MLSLPIYSSPARPRTYRRDPVQLALDHHWSELDHHSLSRLALLRAIRAPLQQACTCPQRAGWLSFGLDQFERGFYPSFQISYHYRSPEESGCSLRPRPGAATRLPAPRPGAAGALPVTFRKGVTPWLPFRRPRLSVARGSDLAPLVAC
jgi:hypothetical protein